MSCWSAWPSACSPARTSSATWTTALGLARRFGPEQTAGLRAAQAELVDRYVAALPAERRRALLAVRPTIDLDPTDVEVYGTAKELIGWTYAGVRAGRPVSLVWAEAGLVLTGMLLAGDQDVRPPARPGADRGGGRHTAGRGVPAAAAGRLGVVLRRRGLRRGRRGGGGRDRRVS